MPPTRFRLSSSLKRSRALLPERQGADIHRDEASGRGSFLINLVRVKAKPAPSRMTLRDQISAARDTESDEPGTHGLSEAEAHRRLLHFGPNETSAVERPIWRLVLAKFFAPVPCLLEAAIVLQVVLGEYFEASIIGILVAFNAALGLFQESRAQATLSALKKRLALNASVLRDETWKVVPAAQLVPGDIVKLSLGSVVRSE